MKQKVLSEFDNILTINKEFNDRVKTAGTVLMTLIPFLGPASKIAKGKNLLTGLSKLRKSKADKITKEFIAKGKNAGLVKEAAKQGKSFFEGTKYTNKVLRQMKKRDFHGFPESVKVFESSGVITTIKGGDGVTRQMLRIPGEYGGKKGFFEFIKEADGTINHRLLRPNP